MAKKKSTPPLSFVQIQGRWQLDGSQSKYLGPDHTAVPAGVCIAASRFRSGSARVTARLAHPDAAGRILIGFDPTTGGYHSVGLGGYGFAYVVDRYTQTRGWNALKAIGSSAQLEMGRNYDLEVEVRGQRVSLAVDGASVINFPLPFPLEGDQAGLFAWGIEPVQFSGFALSGSEPQLFVVMQFGEPYDGLYREVIEPVASRLGFRALRADDLFRPGIILQDVTQSIIESDVVVAEITPANPNVFYEL